MKDFIKKPNLPEGKVISLICGGLNGEIISYLKNRGTEILYSSENCFVDKAVSKHADLSALYLGVGKIILDKRQAVLIDQLKAMGLDVTETEKAVEGTYPDDCLLNHTVIGNYIIGNTKGFDSSVRALAHNLEAISVKQGYCKCSVLVVDEASVITDDESIARKLSKKGFGCLLISKGDVYLDGHEYGFIGGASGKISRNEIIFFGDITKHRDYAGIKGFLDKRDMDIISFDFPLTDFGGIIPIKENIF